jgi:hypothetical protein
MQQYSYKSNCPKAIYFKQIICMNIRKVAGVTRLELAASGVTGQRSNQLSYTPYRAVVHGRRRCSACTAWDFPSQGMTPQTDMLS